MDNTVPIEKQKVTQYNIKEKILYYKRKMDEECAQQTKEEAEAAFVKMTELGFPATEAVPDKVVELRDEDKLMLADLLAGFLRDYEKQLTVDKVLEDRYKVIELLLASDRLCKKQVASPEEAVQISCEDLVVDMLIDEVYSRKKQLDELKKDTTEMLFPAAKVELPNLSEVANPTPRAAPAAGVPRDGEAERKDGESKSIYNLSKGLELTAEQTKFLRVLKTAEVNSGFRYAAETYIDHRLGGPWRSDSSKLQCTRYPPMSKVPSLFEYVQPGAAAERQGGQPNSGQNQPTCTRYVPKGKEWMVSEGIAAREARSAAAQAAQAKPDQKTTEAKPVKPDGVAPRAPRADDKVDVERRAGQVKYGQRTCPWRWIVPSKTTHAELPQGDARPGVLDRKAEEKLRLAALRIIPFDDLAVNTKIEKLRALKRHMAETIEDVEELTLLTYELEEKEDEIMLEAQAAEQTGDKGAAQKDKRENAGDTVSAVLEELDEAEANRWRSEMKEREEALRKEMKFRERVLRLEIEEKEKIQRKEMQVMRAEMAAALANLNATAEQLLKQ